MTPTRIRFAARAAAFLIVLPVLAATSYDEDFTPHTMRLDLYHSGTASEEAFSVDRLRIEGPWPGSRTQLLDHTNLGAYQFEVIDLLAGVLEHLLRVAVDRRGESHPPYAGRGDPLPGAAAAVPGAHPEAGRTRRLPGGVERDVRPAGALGGESAPAAAARVDGVRAR
jgi:hypothetical protein